MRSNRIAVVLGGLAIAGLAAMSGAGLASADSSEGNGGAATGSNPSLSDTMGFGVTNHMKGDDVHSVDGFNGDHNGVGWIRSDQNPSSFAGTNRVAEQIPATLQYQVDDVALKSGNKVAPGQAAKLAK